MIGVSPECIGKYKGRRTGLRGLPNVSPAYQSMNVDGLYPAGEGAGYAGGIHSAAIEGVEVAQAVARSRTSGHAS
ncbi:hypothetical protein FCJ60_16585 [Burkholderia metallica]|nr:hypothetical protein [Burkholderia metallica]